MFGPVLCGEVRFGSVRCCKVRENMEDKIIVGKRRPDFNEFMRPITGPFLCSCGSILSTIQGCYEHWQLGHLDIPVYATREEMMEVMARQIREECKQRRARKL